MVGCGSDSLRGQNFQGQLSIDSVKVKQSRYRPGVAQRVPGS